MYIYTVISIYCHVYMKKTNKHKFNKHRRYSPQTLTRSVVRLHNQSHGHAPTYSYDTSELVFKDMNGKELMEEDDALVDSVSFHDDISVDDIGYHNSEELVEDLHIDEDGTIFIPPQFSADRMIDNVYPKGSHKGVGSDGNIKSLRHIQTPVATKKRSSLIIVLLLCSLQYCTVLCAIN